MAKITKWLLVFGVCFAIGFLLWILPLFFPKRSERILETWEVRRGERRVVVTAYWEKNSFVPGVYYLFEVVDDSKDKYEIMSFRHDDPVPIPHEQVRFVNDQIWYIFMGWQYAVTTDGGSTWSIWNAEKTLPNWQCCNYWLIQDVYIESDGSGIMKLDSLPQRPEEVSTLHTMNYGKTWSLK